MASAARRKKHQAARMVIVTAMTATLVNANGAATRYRGNSKRRHRSRRSNHAAKIDKRDGSNKRAGDLA